MSQISVVLLDDPRCVDASSMASPHLGLTFVRPVPRELVHRSSISEVFVTDGLRRGAGQFSVAAQWPRDHVLYHPDEDGLSDPLLFAETLRQALLYVAHEFCDVPSGRRFIGRDMYFEITDPAALRVGGVPVPVVLDVRWEGEEGRLPGGRLDGQLLVNGRPCGRGGLSVWMADERRYGLLRRMLGGGGGSARAEADPVPAALVAPPRRVGRLREKDCVLERPGPGDDWRLRIDRGHAVLFDHPTDHVPLMVLLEGFRQLGHVFTRESAPRPPGGQSFALVGVSVECAAFAELDEPIRLVIEESGRDSEPGRKCGLRVAALQGETLVARADMAWEATARPGA